MAKGIVRFPYMVEPMCAHMCQRAFRVEIDAQTPLAQNVMTRPQNMHVSERRVTHAVCEYANCIHSLIRYAVKVSMVGVRRVCSTKKMQDMTTATDKGN